MTLADIMTTRVVTVEFDDTLATVKEIFDSLRFHHLLVIGSGSAACDQSACWNARGNLARRGHAEEAGPSDHDALAGDAALPRKPRGRHPAAARPSHIVHPHRG
jgi:CBS domain-containing protein